MSNNLTQTIKTISKKNPSILAVYLHGSKATENATPLSDTDLGIFTYKSFKSNKEQLEFELDLEEQLSKEQPGTKFDIRVINSAPILIKGKIITEGKCLFASDEVKLSDLREQIILPYLDFKIDYDPLIEEIYKRKIHDR